MRRAARDTDESFLRTLFGQSRDDLALLAPPLIDLQFHAQRQQFAATHPDAQHEILVADGVDVGRIVFDRAGTRLRLLDITIHRNHRRRGIATAVLTEVLTGCATATLHVWVGNLAARRLYERLGFTATNDGEGYLAMERRASS